MANAQIKFLNRRGRRALKAILVNEILQILNRQPGVYLTSHEIKNLITPTSLAPLLLLLVNYSGGFAEPASFVGSISSELAQNGILNHGRQKCSVLNKLEDAFAA